jgi:LmbE family N-acetylglucosaminyl deacetylase
MGAEYAYGASQNGLSVRVVYLTCSGPHPDAEIAHIRRSEALTAWSALGIPKDNLVFVNLSQSPVGGPLSYSDQDMVSALTIVKSVISSLPEKAAVIVPARGESHVDHRTLRKVSLEALVESGREDLLIYEVPEYNSFLSLVHCPERAIRSVLRHVPGLNRVVKPYEGSPNYVSGGTGFVFRDTSKRLAKKKELLAYFSSQDGNLLIRLFGYETPHRELTLFVGLSERDGAVGFSAFGGYCDLSVLELGSTLLVIIFLTTHEITEGLISLLSPLLVMDKYLALLGGLVAAVYFIRRIRRTASLETALFAWAAALGLVL